MCLCSLYMVPVPVVVILIGVVLLPKLYKHGGSQIQGWLARRPARFFKKKEPPGVPAERIRAAFF